MSAVGEVEAAGGASRRAHKPLDVLHVAACPFPSQQGTQVYLAGLLRAQRRRGHRVRLLCYGFGDPAVPTDIELVGGPRLPLYRRLRAGPDLVRPLLDSALVPRLRTLRADLVHLHNYEAPLVDFAARCVGSNGWAAPRVYTAHNLMGEELPTYARSAVGAAVGKRLGALLDRSIPRRADAVIALDPRAVGDLVALGCRDVHHIGAGVDPEEIEPVDPAPLPPGPWVVYAGNPDRYQDLDILLAAMARLPWARLLVVSAAPPAAFGSALPARSRVVRAPDFGSVRRLLSAATVAALPRRRCSGFPIKLLDYLGMGLPCVAAEGAAVALPGVVRVAGGDIGAFSGALAALLAAPARRARLGAEGRRHVLAERRWDAVAAAHDRVYTALLRQDVQKDAAGRYDAARQG